MDLKAQSVRRYRALLVPFRWRIITVFSLALLANGVMIVQPYLYNVAIDDIALNTSLPLEQRLIKLAWVSGLMLAFVVICMIATYFQSFNSVILNANVTARLRRALVTHMLHLPLHTLTTLKTGGATARLNRDTEVASQIIHRAIITPGVSAIQLVVALGIVFTLNWRLSVAALCVIVPMGIASQRLATRLRPLFGEIGNLETELAARTTEMFGGVRVARVYRREASERRAYMRMYHRVIRQQLAVSKKQMSTDAFASASFWLIQVMIVALGVYFIIYGLATVGNIFAVIVYANRIMGPVSELLRAWRLVQQDFAAMDRIFEVLDMERDYVDRPGTVEAPEKVESLAFRDVSFSYNGNGTKALANIDVHIPAGKTVALVGRSGAGKSTFTDLLSRFYEPQQGTICINGSDVREIELKSYRSLLGLVQQDIFLFDGTVRDNICYPVPHATDEQVVLAAKRASAHDFILALPNGYRTVIGERGVRLSGGQRQRLSMARAFLVDPKILILDEATSNLDTENEQVIQQAMKELVKDRTTFIIAHRLSTVTDADTIIVLDEGRICEMGTHPELIAKRGAYHEMIERQHRADRL
jgi:ATP-binding cassette, subfamily B, bacterial